MRSKWTLFGLLSFIILSSGCHKLNLCADKLPTHQQLRATWNSIKRQDDPRLLRIWIHRLLEDLLQGGAYQLERRDHTFVIIDPRESHTSRCRMDISATINLLQEPKFLSKLFTLVQKHQIPIQKYLYKPPKTYVIQGDKVDLQISGGNCQQVHYRIEASYWRAISGKFSKKRWPEACKIGKKLSKWAACFTASFKKLYDRRMKYICR